jgi:SAM-dependent methyltransferase
MDEAELGERLRLLARYVLPAGAQAAVIAAGRRDLLELGSGESWEFPSRRPQDGEDDRDWTALVSELEALRFQGAGFLIVPAPARAWLAGRPELQEYIERRYDVVLDRDDTALVYALYGVSGAARAYRAPDHLPVPPPHMVALVSGHYRPRQFFETGVLGADCIRAALARHGVEMTKLSSMLDFACGCGRILRQWKWLTGVDVQGTDYNAHLVEWCRQNLGFADFAVNDLEPPLPYGDDSFDLVYAISAFTHFDEQLQFDWLAELERVVRPGGVLLVTLKGSSCLRELSEEEARRFLAGELVVRGGRIAGSNTCVAFHPESYVRERWTGRLELLEYAEGGAEDVAQDLVLLRKPGPTG